MIRILLFVPVAPKDAFSSIKKSRWQELKSNVRRRLEIEIAVKTGRVRFSGYHHMKSYNANRGDLAIAIAIEAQIKNLLGQAAIVETIGWDDLDRLGAKQVNAGYDGFLIGGGGYVFLDKSGNLNSRAGDYAFLRKLDVPIVAHGIGLNRLMHETAYPDRDFQHLPPATRQYVANLSSCLAAVSVRDASTRALFEQVAKREATLTGDPALSLIKNLGEPPRIDASARYFGVNVATHGWRALAVLETILPSLEQLYKHAVGLGYKMQYFVHDDSEVSIVEYLRRRGFDFTVFVGTPQTMVAEYAKMSFVISQMLHSSILAFSAGTPTLNISYDTKNASFYKLFGLEEFSIPWHNASLNVLADRLDCLIAAREGISERIRSGRDDWIRVQESFLSRPLSSLA